LLPQYGQKKEKVTSKGKKMTAAQLAAAKEVETKAGDARINALSDCRRSRALSPTPEEPPEQP